MNIVEYSDITDAVERYTVHACFCDYSPPFCCTGEEKKWRPIRQGFKFIYPIEGRALTGQQVLLPSHPRQEDPAPLNYLLSQKMCLSTYYSKGSNFNVKGDLPSWLPFERFSYKNFVRSGWYRKCCQAITFFSGETFAPNSAQLFFG